MFWIESNTDVAVACVVGFYPALISRLDVLRGLRRLHWLRERDPVGSELRGWNWDSPPLRPRAYLGLGVSEVAYRYCETSRDVYLRRVAGVEGRVSQPMKVGNIVHSVFHAAAWDVRRLLVNGYEPWRVYEELAGSASKRVAEVIGCGSECDGFGWAVSFYKYLVLGWSSEAARVEALYGGETATWLPWFTEVRVDGSLIGLSSNLRVDALAEGGVVVEVKYGSRREFYQVGLAGYALALESQLEVPVDYGILVYVNGVQEGKPRISYEYVYIDGSLRHEFLEKRDEIIDIVETRREPPTPPSCPRTCPFYEYCRGGMS